MTKPQQSRAREQSVYFLGAATANRLLTRAALIFEPCLT